jgi:predicted RNase H-like HicB family nuclease
MEVMMLARAVIKQKDDWWYGWLVDIPGVNAQEHTKEELIESLIEGAKEMLILNLEENSSESLETIDLPIDELFRKAN